MLESTRSISQNEFIPKEMWEEFQELMSQVSVLS